MNNVSHAKLHNTHPPIPLFLIHLLVPTRPNQLMMVLPTPVLPVSAQLGEQLTLLPPLCTASEHMVVTAQQFFIAPCLTGVSPLIICSLLGGKLGIYFGSYGSGSAYCCFSFSYLLDRKTTPTWTPPPVFSFCIRGHTSPLLLCRVFPGC
jgi:hypothetical protein